MISAIQAYIDAHEAHAVTVAADWLAHLPAWQVAARFDDFAPRCPDRITLDVERRPGNALNVEIGTPLPRCQQRTPVAWGDADPQGRRWLMSGGSPLVLGACGAASCPRAKG